MVELQSIFRRRVLALPGDQLSVNNDAKAIRLSTAVDRTGLFQDRLRIVRQEVLAKVLFQLDIFSE